MSAFLCAYCEPGVSTVYSSDLEDDFCYLNQGFESRWMSVELICYVKSTVFFISFMTSFVGGIF